MTVETLPPRPRRWLRLTLVGVTLAAVTAAAWIAIASWSWGSALADDQRLLPGTTIAGIAVGDTTVDEARAAVQAALDEALDRVVTVTHDARQWHLTPRDAGGSADLDRALTEALDDAAATGFVDQVAFRWLGRTSQLAVALPVTLDPEQVTNLVAALATDIDHDPVDATIEPAAGALQVTDHDTGERLDTDHAHAALLAALDDGETDTVALEVETLTPQITSAMATAMLPQITAVIDRALDRPITLTYQGRTWATSPRDLDARADVAPAIERALEVLSESQTDDQTVAIDAPVPLTVDDATITSLIASIAGEIDVAAVDAQMTATATGVTITDGSAGVAVARADAAARLAEAVTDDIDEVALPTVGVQPDRTAASYEHVLVLRQSDREVDLYEHGVRTHTWPVAVGTGGSPTPTGTFTVGAKRFEPTWVNPSPDGWGKDMPARVGPGPDNPLGVRALNWNRPGGGDTLIRFHGTPNEASIGQAASNGCVRMYNADVVELYELVDSGTTIVSLA